MKKKEWGWSVEWRAKGGSEGREHRLYTGTERRERKNKRGEEEEEKGPNARKRLRKN